MSKIRPKECQNVEFKSSWQDEFLKWICGFANAQGAVMYFGVNDEHEVVGLKNSKKLLKDIPNKIVNYMGLVVDVNLHEQDGLDYIVGRFGTDESDLLIQDIIEGNIIQMADRVVDVLKAKYLASPVRFEGMQRKEELEVPIEALREILYNSITHKDYTGPDIQMHVYNDHVELWNEGELPEGYDEKVLYGKHSSKPRNRNIADTMFKAGFIDTWGRGYKKIHDGFKKAGLPMPTVKSHCGGTLVTFQRGYDVITGR